MGCGYTDSGPLPGYIGFGRQIWLGTRTLASHRSPWQPGQKVSIDGTTVVPVDASTWSLYSYTPHFGGNKSFWNLWQTYFGDDPAAVFLDKGLLAVSPGPDFGAEGRDGSFERVPDLVRLLAHVGHDRRTECSGVMGLPLFETAGLLSDAGVSQWYTRGRNR